VATIVRLADVVTDVANYILVFPVIGGDELLWVANRDPHPPEALEGGITEDLFGRAVLHLLPVVAVAVGLEPDPGEVAVNAEALAYPLMGIDFVGDSASDLHKSKVQRLRLKVKQSVLCSVFDYWLDSSNLVLSLS